MEIQLSSLLTEYFAALNKHDIDAILVPFADNAIVKDEGQEHSGRAAVRSWMEDTTRKYRVTVEAKEVSEESGRTIVSGLVWGNFPGSPVILRYDFTISGPKITRMEIA